jgi:DNA-binding MarR family transcriptional regulator
LSRQVLRDQAFRQRPGLDAWVSFLRGHAALTRALNADLVNNHGLTINDYEVLLHLAQADEHQLRRVDLAERLVLTASGITRLLDGLERAGCVRKARCESDARVTYAVITDTGFEKLKEASKTHLAGINELFESRYSEEELSNLAELLGRLPADGEPGECSVE